MAAFGDSYEGESPVLPPRASSHRVDGGEGRCPLMLRLQDTEASKASSGPNPLQWALLRAMAEGPHPTPRTPDKGEMRGQRDAGRA